MHQHRVTRRVGRGQLRRARVGKGIDSVGSHVVSVV